ncbi:MAG: tRNA (guanosine(46)-N7)-methyltransferase TrmB [Defluviitaleaceae bacterium]|nr:tRNA (guanosine(46)-N7)-methyltransferase TrmB [Defluviitaleaceae bacterium]
MDEARERGKIPAVCELGCGKGRFIIQTAEAGGETLHIGIERDPKIIAAAARLSTGRECDLAFFNADAAGMELFFKPGDVGLLYIHFCDPWPGKKKWAKRRLTHPSFLEAYERLRIPEIRFKTDSAELFGFTYGGLTHRGWSIGDYPAAVGPSGVIKTEYEEKFSSQGFCIYGFSAFLP